MKVTYFLKKLVVFSMLSTCISASARAAETGWYSNPDDPYEPFNRAMFQFNEIIDKFFFKPAATLYIKITPKPVSKGISNFFNNLDTVPTVLNDVLQANFYQATNDAWRLVLNSTLGIAGFIDIGAKIGLEPNKEDFGLTLARWGYKNSNYLVLPFLGPGTVRDQIGWPLTYQFMSLYPYVEPAQGRYGLYLGSLIVRRAELLHFEGVMQQATLDKYTFLRNAFMQGRNYQIEKNNELGKDNFAQNSSDEIGPAAE